ncbi:MAG: family 43 glycosylhydrolase [Opitutaceae bacterium]|jgi:beta-xylosidase|nr:family 43 glycosylhydrolase [Opitutaceae bacterium]
MKLPLRTPPAFIRGCPSVFRLKCLPVLCAFVLGAPAGRAGGFANPVMPGADPHALVDGKTVWVYPTRADPEGGAFYAYSSDDLKSWTRHGPVLRFREVPWIGEDGRPRHGAWAPGVIARGGKWYFYYAVGPQTKAHPARIGVAVGGSPAGPFRDSGRPLLAGGNGFEAIDPMVFADPASGKYYLYAGGSAGAKLRVFELAPGMAGLAAEIPVKTPPRFTEGAFMHFRDGLYYLSYSHGNYKTASYSVHYATAPSPAGPWAYRGAILASDALHKGPGHHSFFINPADGAELIAYHRYDGESGNGPYKSRRKIAFERVYYNADGTIRPIVMTDGGETPAPAFKSPLK